MSTRILSVGFPADSAEPRGLCEAAGLSPHVGPVSERDALSACRADTTAVVLVCVDDEGNARRFIAEVRALGSTPVVALGRGLADETVSRLYEAGVDEVLNHPLNPRVLRARVENLRRRTVRPTQGAETDGMIVVGPYKLCPALLELHKPGRVIHLTPLQAKLLYHLMANAGEIMSRVRLEEKVWGYQGADVDNLIKTHIFNLRRKLEDDPRAPHAIQTVKGVGYMFLDHRALEA